MTLFQWLQLFLSAAGAIVLPLFFFAIKTLWTIRTNDLHAIEARLADLQTRLDRIERKIDEHVTFHAERP